MATYELGLYVLFRGTDDESLKQLFKRENDVGSQLSPNRVFFHEYYLSRKEKGVRNKNET